MKRSRIGSWIAVAALATAVAPCAAHAAVTTYSFTQNVGIGNQLYGAFTSTGVGLQSSTVPVTFDFTLGNALAANTSYVFGYARLDANGSSGGASGDVLDFNFSDGTPISSFSSSQFSASYPGSNPDYYARFGLRTDGFGAISQYSIRVSAISSYSGPLTAGFTAPTNIQFYADSTTALSAASLLISVLNSSRRGTPDFGGLICTSVAQNCGGGFTLKGGGGAGGVPEPASWALMVTGFGLVGAAMRRRRTMVAA